MDRKSNLQYMAIALLFCAVLLLTGCSNTAKHIIVDGKTLSKAEVAQVNVIHKEKVSRSALNRAVLRLELSERSNGYENIPKEKFDNYDEAEAELAELEKKYAGMCVQSLYYDIPDGDMPNVLNQILKYQVIVGNLLKDFGIMK